MAKTYPLEAYPADAAIQALDGTVDAPTGLAYIPKGTDSTSTPSLEVQFNRRLARQNRQLDNACRVVAEVTALNIGVYPINYVQGGAIKSFDGSSGIVLADNTVTFVWIDNANAVATGAAWPGVISDFVPLAKVTTAGGVVTAIEDWRGAARYRV